MSTTESGWPVLKPGDSLIRTILIPTEAHDSVHLPLRWGTPALLLPHLLMCFDDQVEDVDGPVVDDWGYAFRAVRGYSDWSDHSGGIAADINATRHPLGKRGSFTAAQHNTIEKLINLPLYRAANGRSVFYWGGNYHNRADEMHFGLAQPLSACEPVSRRLLDSARGELVCASNPGLRKYVLS